MNAKHNPISEFFFQLIALFIAIIIVHAVYVTVVRPEAQSVLEEQRALLRRLADMQYTRNDQVFQRGTYRVRGDVVDIFPAESEREAVRVELFDDEIEDISLFDPLTGEVINRVPRYTVFPKTHYVTPRERILSVLDDIKDELQDRLNYLTRHNKLVEAQRLEQRTRFDLEMISELGYCSGIENYSRYLSGRETGEPPPLHCSPGVPEVLARLRGLGAARL